MREKDALFCVAMIAVVTIDISGFPHKHDATPTSRVVVEHPVVNLPKSLWQANWSKGGSCVHASLVSLLRWQGECKLADRWRRTHSGGERWYTMAGEMDDGGIPYALHTSGDPAFLEWAIATRRGAAIQIKNNPRSKSYHMITLVDLTENYACILDNNDTRRVKWIDRDALVTNWQRSMGWAFTPVYSPAAPMPPQRREEI